MTNAREAVLARVRAAQAAAGLGAAGAAPSSPLPGPPPLDQPAALARLEERLREFGADVRATEEVTLADAVGAACAAHGARRLVAPADWPEAWTPAGLDVTRDEQLSPQDLGMFDGALTGARMGIAESGTLVFDGGPTQGRRLLTLLPELHVCVLRTADVVDSIGAAMARLRPAAGGGAHAPLTFVSGPSATTDIELTRIEGVHGPRRLAVILLGER
jgi:L-lactate dehydrogenase complex protein LldG